LIALAIIDMVMPGMSGLDLAAELDRLRPGMKILYTSGHVSSVAMESIAQRSPDRVLFKPFDGNELLDRVIQLVGSDAVSEAAAEGLAAMAESTSAPSENAWHRLIEASDRIDTAAVEVIGYRDTGAAFAIAAAHSAALRAAGLRYAFRSKTLEALPFALFVASRDLRQARELIERVGLGVDVVQPA
jgi:DNA-binding NtrC family response regulator